MILISRLRNCHRLRKSVTIAFSIHCLIFRVVAWVYSSVRIARWMQNLRQLSTLLRQVWSGCFCDHTSNYKGKYRFQYPLVLSQDNWRPALGSVSTLIHIGGVSGAYTQPGGERIWRVNEDGAIRSVYGLPEAVFEMREVDFFRHYMQKGR